MISTELQIRLPAAVFVVVGLAEPVAVLGCNRHSVVVQVQHAVDAQRRHEDHIPHLATDRNVSGERTQARQEWERSYMSSSTT